jgi:hypothetical protein
MIRDGRVRLPAALAIAAIVVTSAPARAATPTTATLSAGKRAVSWKGTATLSSPYFVTSELDCNLVADPACDHFALRVDLGEGAKIQLTLRAEDPADPNDPAKAYNDWDVYVYAPGPAAAPIAVGAEIGDESVTFIHRGRYRKQPYDIAIRSWLSIPGTTYTATAKAITLGR